MIDPSWYLLPFLTATGWLGTGKNGVSIRGVYAHVLLFLWMCRFLYQWPWEGWKEGLKREDWRFVDFAKKLGHNSVLYWLWSLFGFHLAQSLMTFLAIAPLQLVVSAGSDDKDLDMIDLAAFLICFAAINISYFADK